MKTRDGNHGLPRIFMKAVVSLGEPAHLSKGLDMPFMSSRLAVEGRADGLQTVKSGVSSF